MEDFNLMEDGVAASNAPLPICVNVAGKDKSPVIAQSENAYDSTPFNAVFEKSTEVTFVPENADCPILSNVLGNCIVEETDLQPPNALRPIDFKLVSKETSRELNL
ncbi:MAG: hypothetical protein MR919_03025 [Parabacteroides sp.]|nr:hypothetical protein [Parabacteroides sp.]